VETITLKRVILAHIAVRIVVAGSVCVFVTAASPTKTDEPNEMPFGARARALVQRTMYYMCTWDLLPSTFSDTGS